MRLLLLLVLLIISGPVSSQAVRGKVVYDYDQKLERVTIPREAILLFNEEQTVFYHSRGSGIVMVDIDGREGGADMTYTTGPDHDGGAVIDMYQRDELGHTFYFDLNKNQFTGREIVYFTAFKYQEPSLPEQQWTLLDSTKMIGQYVCRAASTTFRGRKYLAWFTPEIPLSHGPWKLRGLPGLILEATDAEHAIKFVARTIEFKLTPEDAALITPPEDGKSITFLEFQDIYQREQRKWARRGSSLNDRGETNGEIRQRNTVERFVKE